MGKRIQPLSLLLFVSDTLIVLIALWLAAELRSLLPFGRSGALPVELTRIPGFVYLLAILTWGGGLIFSRAYDPHLSLRWFMEAFRVLWGAGLGTGLMAGALYLTYRELARLQFAYFFLVAVALMISYRMILRIYYRLIGRHRPGGRNRILILGAGSLGERVAKTLLDHSRWGYNPAGFLDDEPEKHGQEIFGLPVIGPLDDLRDEVPSKKIDELWIALPARSGERLREIIDLVETLPVRIKVVPDYFSLALVQTKTEVLGDLPVIGLRDPLIEGAPRMVKRTFDLAITLMLMPIAIPLLALFALAIRLDTPGPIFFNQTRIGENGRLFEMIKLRTMVVGAADAKEDLAKRDGDIPVIHKKPDDPRVTRVGRFLRRYSFDELPQLFNVIKGDMSLVGPRPEMPWLVDRYDAWQRKRFAVPQGITGWWQINGRSDKPMHLNTEDDLYYVYNYSFWLDILILLRTPFAVLRGVGAF